MWQSEVSRSWGGGLEVAGISRGGCLDELLVTHEDSFYKVLPSPQWQPDFVLCLSTLGFHFLLLLLLLLLKLRFWRGNRNAGWDEWAGMLACLCAIGRLAGSAAPGHKNPAVLSNFWSSLGHLWCTATEWRGPAFPGRELCPKPLSVDRVVHYKHVWLNKKLLKFSFRKMAARKILLSILFPS